MWYIWGRGGMHAWFWWGRPEGEREDGIKLDFEILEKLFGRMGAGLFSLRTGISGRLF
jgi:hypothetical protein